MLAIARQHVTVRLLSNEWLLQVNGHISAARQTPADESATKAELLRYVRSPSHRTPTSYLNGRQWRELPYYAGSVDIDDDTIAVVLTVPLGTLDDGRFFGIFNIGPEMPLRRQIDSISAYVVARWTPSTAVAGVCVIAVGGDRPTHLPETQQELERIVSSVTLPR